MSGDIFYLLMGITAICFLSAMARLAYLFSKNRIDHPLGSTQFTRKVKA